MRKGNAGMLYLTLLALSLAWVAAVVPAEAGKAMKERYVIALSQSEVRLGGDSQEAGTAERIRPVVQGSGVVD